MDNHLTFIFICYLFLLDLFQVLLATEILRVSHTIILVIWIPGCGYGEHFSLSMSFYYLTAQHCRKTGFHSSSSLVQMLLKSHLKRQLWINTYLENERNVRGRYKRRHSFCETLLFVFVLHILHHFFFSKEYNICDCDTWRFGFYMFCQFLHPHIITLCRTSSFDLYVGLEFSHFFSRSNDTR